MESFNIEQNASKSKHQQNPYNYFYYNLPKTMRSFANESALRSNTSRSASVFAYSYPWSDRSPQQPLPSTYTEKKLSENKFYSVALAIASFVVLVAILATVGLALHMGILHTDTPNALITFSCSAKLLKESKSVMFSKEDVRRYQEQCATLYSRSILGQTFLSCVIDKLSYDNTTIYFQLTFNKKKLTKNITSVEKAIKDILLTDAISTNSVFKRFKFDPKYVIVKAIISNDGFHVFNSAPVEAKSSNVHDKKGSIIRKTTNTTGMEKISKAENVSATKGSFTVTKIELGKGDKNVTVKSKAEDKLTTKKTSMKLTTVPSTLYKIASIKKITQTTTTATTLKTSIGTFTLTELTTEPYENVKTEIENTSPVIDPNEQPWLPNLPPFSDYTPPLKLSVASKINKEPVYVSFTNPSLTNEANHRKKPLSDVNIKSHPIPVIKIPYTAVFSTTAPKEEFEETETLEQISTLLKNLTQHPDINDENMSENFGEAQVEVAYEDYLPSETTKIPLVTLLPAKSNSGIGRPIRKRPDNNNRYVDANLQFTERDLKIFSTLNFFSQDENVKTSEIDQDRSLKRKKITHPILIPVNSSVSNKRHIDILTIQEIQKLSEISKIVNNSAIPEKNESGSKAISPGLQQNGLSILGKPFNKKVTTKPYEMYNNDNTNCDNLSIICDGKCLPQTTKCNYLVDCINGYDEENCTCADYLKSQFLIEKICDGIVDCWDYSDENQCDWCQVGQYVCSDSKVCIDNEKICDGIKNCPDGDDEKHCVILATDVKSAQEYPYQSEGFLMVRKQGKWGKLCVDNLRDVVTLPNKSWDVPELGKAVCQSMTYSGVDSVMELHDINDTSALYYELAFANLTDNKSLPIFKESECTKKYTIKVKCRTLECGAQPHLARHVARVVGGGNALLGAWPWQAALYKEGEFQCGATLLSDKWLVSAGHCFYHFQQDFWVARLGILRRGTTLPSPYEQLKNVVRIIIHPGYLDSGFINDISLLQLESSVIFTDYVRPVCLPHLQQAPNNGQLCTIIGWGQLYEVGRIFPDTLQEVQVPIISTGECRKITVFLPLYHITDDMFCAGYERGGRDACLGDSGGPLMCPENDGRWTLQGITSNGYGCARANRPGVYTKVASYLNWINFNINNEKLNSESVTVKNSCSGRRCPLGECLSESRLCNGFIECSDGSDEKNCQEKRP